VRVWLSLLLNDEIHQWVNRGCFSAMEGTFHSADQSSSGSLVKQPSARASGQAKSAGCTAWMSFPHCLEMANSRLKKFTWFSQLVLKNWNGGIIFVGVSWHSI
jgi:hypothetical protein